MVAPSPVGAAAKATKFARGGEANDPTCALDARESTCFFQAAAHDQVELAADSTTSVPRLEESDLKAAQAADEEEDFCLKVALSLLNRPKASEALSESAKSSMAADQMTAQDAGGLEASYQEAAPSPVRVAAPRKFARDTREDVQTNARAARGRLMFFQVAAPSPV